MRIAAGAVLLFAGCISAGCDQKLSTLAGPTPNLEPTFSSVQSQIFETTDVAGRQACVNCHTNVGRNPSGGLNLAHALAYDQIVNVASSRKPGAIRVIPGDPENSYLVHKIEGRAGIGATAISGIFRPTCSASIPARRLASSIVSASCRMARSASIARATEPRNSSPNTA